MYTCVCIRVWGVCVCTLTFLFHLEEGKESHLDGDFFLSCQVSTPIAFLWLCYYNSQKIRLIPPSHSRARRCWCNKIHLRSLFFMNKREGETRGVCWPYCPGMCVKHTKIQRNIKLRTQKELIQMTASHITEALHLINSWSPWGEAIDSNSLLSHFLKCR